MAERRLRKRLPRVVQAPAPTLSPFAPLPPNCVISVDLRPAEDVEWIWTSGPNGGSYVSGYTII
jgi:hypothetical protein